ncbi:MAG: alpha/beta hydrolase-fold protein [Anaerolineae bacterium]|nr:alpha/beta hydrolase-fold protein [Anaerolineae bacterium]
MKNLFPWLLIVLIVISGCTTDGQTNSPTLILPSPESTQALLANPTSVQPTPVPDSPLPTATATERPTPTITPSPTPFICSFMLGRTESETFFSNLMGEQVAYLVHLPPCYDQFPTYAFPTLYLFHGWPLNEYHWVNLGVDVYADDYVSRGITGPYIIVMPGVGSEGLFVNSSGGSYSFEGMVVDELVPHIDGKYRTWRLPAARAVGGISRGGVWALEIALRHQDLFSIVGGHSPALALNRPLPQYDPYRLVIEGAGDLRFYLDAGDNDWARAAAINFRDFLEDREVPVTYDLHQGGHVDALWRSGLSDYLLFYAETWPRSYEDLPLWTLPPVE